MQLVRATRTDSSPPVPSSRGENSSFCLRRLSREHHYLLSLVAYSPTSLVEPTHDFDLLH
jgi:hypothetical protein